VGSLALTGSRVESIPFGRAVRTHALFGLFDGPKSIWDTKNMTIDADLTPEYGDVPDAPPKPRRAGVVMHPTSFAGPYGERAHPRPVASLYRHRMCM
jgi:hypothetical protein